MYRQKPYYQSIPSHRGMCSLYKLSLTRNQLIINLKHWNGKFFERKALKDLGGRIQLGHAIGEPCSLPTPAFNDSFTIIDINGIHDIGLDFCGCGRHGTMAQQLLRFRLYPATAQNPNTAATFRALHHFQLLSFESKCSVYEFYQTLVRESDNTSRRKVKVCELVKIKRCLR